MTDVTVYFAGLTGPDRSGGAMAISFQLLVDGKPRVASAQFVPEHPDGSWNTATYVALRYVLQQCHASLGNSPTFITDNEMVIRQMVGIWSAKDGHYLTSRDDALVWMNKVFSSSSAMPKFKWVAAKKNLAIKAARDLIQIHGIEPWSYKKEKQREKDEKAGRKFMFIGVSSNEEIAWETLKDVAHRNEIVFRVAFDQNDLHFHLGPDTFKDSFRLAWTDPAERAGAPYRDRRCRSSHADDFLSRIASLVDVRVQTEADDDG